MKLLQSIIDSCVAVAVIYDESKNIDENGEWERHYINKERKKKRKSEAHRKKLLF